MRHTEAAPDRTAGIAGHPWAAVTFAQREEPEDRTEDGNKGPPSGVEMAYARR
jgi:hypothetical protein